MKKVLFLSACIVLGVLIGMGCGGGSNSSSNPVTSTPTTSNSLVFTVSTPKATYALGATVPITFTVVNTGTQAANLTVGSCLDYIVQVNLGTQLLWTGPDVTCAGITRPVTIPAGATQTYNTSWNQLNSQGNAVSAGTYTITGAFDAITFNGTTLTGAQVATFASNPISITITP